VSSDSKWTRREFLKTSVAATAVSSLWPGFALGDSALQTQGSVVVWVESGAVMDDHGSVDASVLERMIDRALCELTGEKDPRDAWARFVKPTDTVGLKVNTLGLKHVRRSKLVAHFPAVGNVLTKRLVEIVGRPERLTIWDRYDRELEAAGFQINHDGPGVRCLGWKKKIGPGKKEYRVGGKKTRFSRILDEEISALINIPVPKTHRIAGITGALKNHYGSITNPRDFHGNGCTEPGIPELNALPPVREKTRLILVDALWTVIDGGPGWSREAMRPTRSVLVSTDPVAVDRVLLKIIDEARRAEGLPPKEPLVRFLALAEKQELGVADLQRIKIVKVKGLRRVGWAAG